MAAVPALLTPIAASAGRDTGPDLAIVSAIREEGLRRSRLIDYARRINDDLGARRTIRVAF